MLSGCHDTGMLIIAKKHVIYTLLRHQVYLADKTGKIRHLMFNISDSISNELTVLTVLLMMTVTTLRLIVKLTVIGRSFEK